MLSESCQPPLALTCPQVPLPGLPAHPFHGILFSCLQRPDSSTQAPSSSRWTEMAHHQTIIRKPLKLWVLFPVTVRKKHLLFCFACSAVQQENTSVASAETNKADTKPRNLLEIKKFSFASSWESEGEDCILWQMPSGLGGWGWHCLARAVRPLHGAMDGGGVFCQDDIGLGCRGLTLTPGAPPGSSCPGQCPGLATASAT